MSNTQYLGSRHANADVKFRLQLSGSSVEKSKAERRMSVLSGKFLNLLLSKKMLTSSEISAKHRLYRKQISCSSMGLELKWHELMPALSQDHFRNFDLPKIDLTWPSTPGFLIGANRHSFNWPFGLPPGHHGCQGLIHFYIDVWNWRVVVITEWNHVQCLTDWVLLTVQTFYDRGESRRLGDTFCGARRILFANTVFFFVSSFCFGIRSSSNSRNSDFNWCFSIHVYGVPEITCTEISFTSGGRSYDAFAHIKR